MRVKENKPFTLIELLEKTACATVDTVRSFKVGEMRDEVKNNSGSLAVEKSFAFALRIVKLYQHLSDKKKEFVLSKQILRSGTSIGANLEESRGAQSSSDFQAKISIAYKEARETSYWLRLLCAAKYITAGQFNSIHADCEELIRILSATQLIMKTKIQKEK